VFGRSAARTAFAVRVERETDSGPASVGLTVEWHDRELAIEWHDRELAIEWHDRELAIAESLSDRSHEKESKPRERVRVESCRPELVPADASALQAKRHFDFPFVIT
jgi:hypothetical protein